MPISLQMMEFRVNGSWEQAAALSLTSRLAFMKLYKMNAKQRIKCFWIIFIYWHATLNEQITSKVIQPTHVINFSCSLHIIHSFDRPVNRTLLVQSINFRIDEVFGLVLSWEWRELMDGQLVVCLLAFVQNFSFVWLNYFIAVLVEDSAFSTEAFY